MGNYLPSSAEERASMLADIGYASMDDLYAGVPGGASAVELDMPAGLSELEVSAKLEALADKNVQFKSIFRGGGAQKHYIPAIVETVAANEKFLTSYTPYQAEISQGVLQSIFEYQTMVCELFGMDASNASVYDVATAAAEAVFMCEERKKSGVAISAAVNPQIIEVVQTYCEARSVEVTLVDCADGRTDLEAFKAALDSEPACAIIPQINFFGVLEQTQALIDAAHEAGAKAVVIADPLSMGILATPGEMGADICVAEGQALGLPLSFGGPYLGIMCCTDKMTRKLPGRIVGETTDGDGNRAFVLTLQAREQHIRREKASSNICSNQALCALTAGVYLAAMGADGVKQAAQLCFDKAHYLAEQLSNIDGFDLVYDQPFFNEVLISTPIDSGTLEAKLAEGGILSGLPLEEGMLWCATEMNSKEDIDELVEAVRKAVA